jgi:1-deoxy-D-xylulose-5-phosphate synthase
MLIMAPADENECRQMLQTAYEYSGPAIVRYPRGVGPGVEVSDTRTPLQVGKGEIVREGKKIALLAFGSMLAPAQQATGSLNATVVNMRFVKPLDEALIIELSEKHDILVTLEENVIQGGAGSAVNECLAKHNISIDVLNLGLPDRYMERACSGQQLKVCRSDGAGIVDSINEHMGDEKVTNSLPG